MGQGRRAELSWAAYDWANSAFATTVLAGLFPVLFKQYWSSGVDAATSTMRLGIANSVAAVVVMLLGPILGAIADAGGLGKRLLLGFAVLGTSATGALWLVARGDWLAAAGLFTLANVGFLGANVFYDALLVHVAEPGERDRVSALGYALGYLGGGLLFAFNVACVTWPSAFGFADRGVAGRVAFLTVAGWWLVFTMPLLWFVREPHDRSPVVPAVHQGLRQLRRTFSELRRLRTVSLFLIGYWLYIDGVDTIIRMSVDYGMAIGLDSHSLIAALLLTQFVGFPAAIAFGKLGQRVGAKRAVLIGILAYVAVTVGAATMHSARTFFVLAAGIGLVQGGVQALSRSLFSRMVPATRASEFFGFYNLLGKSAAVVGPLLLGVTSRLTGEPRLSILVILVLLLGGGALLLRVDPEAGEREAEALSSAD